MYYPPSLTQSYSSLYYYSLFKGPGLVYFSYRSIDTQKCRADPAVAAGWPPKLPEAEAMNLIEEGSGSDPVHHSPDA